MTPAEKAKGRKVHALVETEACPCARRCHRRHSGPGRAAGALTASASASIGSNSSGPMAARRPPGRTGRRCTAAAAAGDRRTSQRQFGFIVSCAGGRRTDLCGRRNAAWPRITRTLPTLSPPSSTLACIVRRCQAPRQDIDFELRSSLAKPSSIIAQVEDSGTAEAH